MSGNTYELTYFPIKGLGNTIRLILEDQAVEYSYTVISMDSWPEHKPNTPLGQLPVLTINGETKLAQSHSIARYLGREFNLMGSNNLEQAQVEMWIDQTIDIRGKLNRVIYGNFEAEKQPLVDSIPALLEPFEKQLASQEDKSHLLLGKLTVADYTLYDSLLILVALSSDCLDSSPSVKAFFESFGAREKIAAFLNRDDVKETKFSATEHI